MGRRETHTEVWLVDLTETDHLGDIGVVGRIVLKIV